MISAQTQPRTCGMLRGSIMQRSFVGFLWSAREDAVPERYDIHAQVG